MRAREKWRKKKKRPNDRHAIPELISVRMHIVQPSVGRTFPLLLLCARAKRIPIEDWVKGYQLPQPKVGNLADVSMIKVTNRQHDSWKLEAFDIFS